MTSWNALVVSLAPPTAEREREEIFLPKILLFAALLNRLIYCALSRSPLVNFAVTAVIVPSLPVLIVKFTATW